MKKLNFKENPNLIDEITESLAQDSELEAFFIKHDIGTQTIEESLSELLIYKKENARCVPCKGLDQCTQETRGMRPVLRYRREKITLEYKPCEYAIAHEKRRESKDRINALYLPKMIFEATLQDFHMDTEARKRLYQKIMGLSNQYAKGETIKGLYIHGRYQIGKTYTLAAIANRFSELGYEVLIAYYPDLVREIKSAISKGNLEERINALKTVDILCLDDIGGEAFSEWIRDEVLGPVLQYRLLDQKPTFFSSNVPTEELASNFISTDQQTEKIKGYRIIERIRALSETINMK